MGIASAIHLRVPASQTKWLPIILVNFRVASYSLVGYILKQLFTSVLVDVEDIYRAEKRRGKYPTLSPSVNSAYSAYMVLYMVVSMLS